MPRVGLHMIVKDEEHVLERCLRSVLPLVDWWVVVDTGSSDGTRELVRKVMADRPGQLLERPWVSFGHNRQEALQAAEDLAESTPDDLVLWIDADEEMVGLPETLRGWEDTARDADAVSLDVRFGDLRYHRVAGVRLGRGWRWTGAVHEYLDLPGARVTHLPAPTVLVRKEGARSLDPDTYRKDAALLEAELRRNPDDPRTQFYLAQSWSDAGEVERALEAYRLRAANERGWHSERAVALHRVARCLERLDRCAEEVVAAYAAAWEAAPHRAEPLVDLARTERLRGRHHLAHLYAERAVALPVPDPSELFVDVATYTWRALDEYAVACGWTGRLAEGRRAAEAALAAHPDEPRLRANLAWFDEQQSVAGRGEPGDGRAASSADADS